MHLKTADHCLCARPGKLASACRGLTLALACLLCGLATAQEVTFTTNAWIPEGDTTYAGWAVTVDNCTLTVDGEHGFSDLTVTNSGIVTHTVGATGLTLIVSNDVTVAAGSRIGVNGRGATTREGTTNNSGGSYGGRGQNSGNGVSCPVYGNALWPLDLGSGGAGRHGGARGGGRIMIIADSLTLDGELLANGASGFYVDGHPNGAGSGGSILLDVETLTGGGTIQANGGSRSGDAGGGGGGRVAVYFNDAAAFDPLAIECAGSEGAGPGTLYWRDRTAAYGTLTVQNFGRSQGASPTHVHVATNDTAAIVLASNVYARLSMDPAARLTSINGAHARIEGQGQLDIGTMTLIDSLWDQQGTVRIGSDIWLTGTTRVTHPVGWQPGLDLRVNGRLLIDTNTVIDVSGKSKTAPAAEGSAGGSHGGLGGAHSGIGANPVYGSDMAPLTLGTRGGGAAHIGNHGGGRATLRAGMIELQGTIQASGRNGPAGVYAGGGSGGSILLNAGAISGSGRVMANGGAAEGTGGGGGGGRIAVHYWDTMTLAVANLSAVGGVGSSQNGQNGTVIVNDQPYLTWFDDETFFHGPATLFWPVLAADTNTTRARVTVAGRDRARTIAQEASIASNLIWDSTMAPDGAGVMTVEFFHQGTSLGQIARNVLTINNARVHSGEIITDDVWSNDTLHILRGLCTVASGVTLTIEPATTVKAMRGAQLNVADGGVLTILGEADRPIVMTSLYDATVGGDTLNDGGRIPPRPGDWQGLGCAAAGTLDLNEHLDMRYTLQVFSGILATDQTWLRNTLYFIEDAVTVPDGVTLTIQPGAVIKLALGKSLMVQAGGTLLAEGTFARPIVFTSISDDTVGGDTNNDGDATAPEAGDWQWIFIDGGVAEFTHCDIRYGGGPLAGGWGQPGGPGKAAIKTSGAEASLRFVNSRMIEAAYDGILCWGGQAFLANSIFKGIDRAVCAHPGGIVAIVNSTLDGNRVGLLSHGGAMAATNCIVVNSASAAVLKDLTGPDPVVRHCAFWNNTADFQGVTDGIGSDGNIATNPRFKDPPRDNYRLAYLSPMIDAADGTVAPSTDASGAPRFSDPRSAPSGIPAANGMYADIGAFEFVENAESAIDLVVTEFEVPAQAEVGAPVRLAWRVRNQGAVAAAGPWHDVIGLTPVGSEAALTEVGTYLVGDGLVLQPGETVLFEREVVLPGVLPGRYRWQATVNIRQTVFEGRNRENNTLLSMASTAVALREIEIGGEAMEGVLSPGTNVVWYIFTPQAGSNLLVRLNLEAPAARSGLYVAYGAIPTADAFSYYNGGTGSDATVLISGAYGQPYYLMISADGLLGDTPFTVTVASCDIAIEKVSPAVVGNDGAVTLAVSGAGLVEDMDFELIDAAGVAYRASRVARHRNGVFYATFSLVRAATGRAHVQALIGGGAIRKDDVIELAPADRRAPYYSISAPENIRFGRDLRAIIEYGNAGNVDAPAPVVRYTALDCAVKIEADDPWQNELQLILTAPDGPAGILRAGQRGQIEVRFKMTRSAARIDHRLTVDRADTLIDWDRWKVDIRPSWIDDASWRVVMANMRERVGNTHGSLHMALSVLSSDDSRLARDRSEVGQDVNDLMAGLLRQSGLYDLPVRFRMGVFGLGQPDPFAICLRSVREDLIELLHENVPVDLFAHEAGYDRWTSVSGSGALMRTNGVARLRKPDGMTYQFDERGRVDYVEDAYGYRTDYRYDGERLVELVADNGDTTTLAYNADGLIAAITEPDGNLTVYEYDDAMRLTRIGAPEGDALFTYYSGQGDAVENAVETFRFPGDGTWRVEYDQQGRQLTVARPDGAERRTYTYEGNRYSVSDALGNTLIEEHDIFGRTRRIADRHGREFVFDYDENDNLTQLTGPLGIERRSVDARGNVVHYSNSAGDHFYVRHGDDVSPSVLEYVDALGRIYRYERNRGGEATTTLFPGGDWMATTYDERGQPIHSQTSAGREATRAYNDHNQLVAWQACQGMVTQHVEYGYDEGRRLRTVTDEGGEHIYRYDSGGRLLSVEYTDGRGLYYTYNEHGLRSAVSDHDGYTQYYGYDGHARLIAVSNSLGVTLVAYAYDGAGDLARKTFVNGTRTEYTYTPSGLPSTITHSGAEGEVFSRFEWAYDRRGLPVTLQTTQGTWHYEFDDSGRLVSAETPDGNRVRYTYDAMDNRTAVETDGQTQTYDVNDADQYLRIGETTLEYDADGNLIAKRTNGEITHAYEYDARNRLVRYVHGDDEWQYSYEPSGLLQSVIHNGVRVDYLIDPTGMGHVFAEYDADGGLIARYAIGFGIECRLDAADGMMFYHDGAVGNVSETTDATGQVANRYAYMPFGEESLREETIPNPFRFNGTLGVLDDGSGLLHMRARPYDPSQGRFIQRDPIGALGGLPLYGFVNANPIIYHDAIGLVEGLHTRFYNKHAPEVKLDIRRDFTVGYHASPQGAKLIMNFLWGTFDTGVGFIPGVGNVWAAATAAIQVFRGEYTDAALRAVGAIPLLGNFRKMQEGVCRTSRALYVSGRVVHYGSKAKFQKIYAGTMYLWDTALPLVMPGEQQTVAQTTSRVVQSYDPNEIIGPAGYGDLRWVHGEHTLQYTILFENVSTAAAPAQVVTIVHPLDAQLDLDTFELGGFGWHTNVVAVPDGRQSHATDILMPPIASVTNILVTTNTLLVRFSAALDHPSRTVTWRFETLDPFTHELPEDPFAGFLPPNLSDGIGEGFVTYRVYPAGGVTNNPEIVAVADIVFDDNEPIVTDPFSNTVDSLPPVSAVRALPGQVPQRFPVVWDGDDAGAGIRNFDIYVSREGAPYQLWLAGTAETEALFEAEPGVRYRFFSVATDNVGQREGGRTTAAEQAADAATVAEFRFGGTFCPDAQRVVISWESAEGLQYRVLSGTNLTKAVEDWTLEADNVAAQPPANTVTNAIDTDESVRFFRIERKD